ncbi:ComF family protein [Aquirufa rosea]|uniref:ComF family protein n=1 Tax=Aquirufa rosea TaxID=2509241 RepID=A0A4Q1C1E8_9BACT|nr:phosphoribosyltransferase family protein [Aquirufa rosea]RXK50993.1 ComF family protein [Aquirufa rosea]
MFKRILQLLYPDVCFACAKTLLDAEKLLCTNCLFDLPRPGFFLSKPNWLSLKFDGWMEYQDAQCFFLFSEGGRVQKIMHQIKYQGAQNLGYFLGAWCGKELNKYNCATIYDLIIPVPIHQERLKERGYNQAMCIAEGISDKTQIPISSQCVERMSFSQTLIHQNRQDRFTVLEDVFQVIDSREFLGKHVLIVDDTLTTGSTMLALGIKVKTAGAKKVSFLALAALQ